eukprot:COSAG04_NODE_16838_length_487_cov_1.067010_1_plen_28_part_10
MYALTATIGYEDCICSFDCGFDKQAEKP